jgi:histidine triad (HIT) family protein
MTLQVYSNKMKCEYCEIIERNKEPEIIYQDEEVVVAIKDLTATTGQVTVFPREHHTILEIVPDNILEKCAVLANKVGMAIFDGLAAQGTNVIVQNGLGAGQKTPHFGIEIIPRREEDNIDLQWEPKQMMEDELESTLMAIKDSLEKKEEVKVEKIDEVKEKEKGKKKKSDKDNYLLKSIRKRP